MGGLESCLRCRRSTGTCHGHEDGRSGCKLGDETFAFLPFSLFLFTLFKARKGTLSPQPTHGRSLPRAGR